MRFYSNDVVAGTGDSSRVLPERKRQAAPDGITSASEVWARDSLPDASAVPAANPSFTQSSTQPSQFRGWPLITVISKPELFQKVQKYSNVMKLFSFEIRTSSSNVYIRKKI